MRKFAVFALLLCGMVVTCGCTFVPGVNIHITFTETLMTIFVDAVNGDDSDGTGSEQEPFRTITKALTRAGNRSTIWVADGTYDTGLGEVFPLKLRNVILYGLSGSPSAVRIAGPIEGYKYVEWGYFSCGPELTIFSGSKDSVFLYGVEVDSAVEFRQSCSYIAMWSVSAPSLDVSVGRSLYAEGCDFDFAEVRGGADVHALFRYSHFREVLMQAKGNFYSCKLGGGLAVDNCIVIRGGVPVGLGGTDIYGAKTGVLVEDECEVELRGCNMEDLDCAIYLESDARAWIRFTDISQVGRGIEITDSASAYLEQNDILGCEDYALVVSSTSPDIDLGGGTLGSIGENTIRNNFSYGNAYPSIRDERPANAGSPIYAINNMWDGSGPLEPTGTVSGPATDIMNYEIINAGNSIIFSN